MFHMNIWVIAVQIAQGFLNSFRSFLQDDPMMIRAQPASSSQSQTQLNGHVNLGHLGAVRPVARAKIVNGISTMEMRSVAG